MKLLYVQEWRRPPKGKLYRYYRRRGYPRIRLPDDVPTNHPKFLEAYLKASEQAEAKRAEKRAPKKGTMAELCQSYINSSNFQNLRPITQRTYMIQINWLRENHGHGVAAELRRRHVEKLVSIEPEAPSRAHQRLKVLRVIMRYALSIDMIQIDPTIGVTRSARTDGYLTWSDEHIDRFRRYWPIGSTQRLALELMLNTGARKSDAVKLGDSHLHDGAINFTSQKTRVAVSVPVLPELSAALSAREQLFATFLATEVGKPRSPNGFGNYFRESCDKAGLKGLSAHGLRKACCRRLAEAGCTPHQIMAISGHKTLAEAQRYTRSVNKRKLADEATERLKSVNK